MKAVFKKIAIVALMLGTFTSYANEIAEVKSSYYRVEKGNYISVSDAFGEVIYSAEINNNGNLIKLFDFTQLKNGEYNVEVTKDFEIEVNTILVKNNIVSILDSNKKTIFTPVVRNEESRILVSKLALDAEKMEVEIYFEDELIHTESVEGETILNRVYKLDETLKGNYTTVIRSNDRVFVKNFRI
ncbi:hypothetical protein HNV08_00180 [Winogradskyella eckloniae]|uniref:hypothetical protein n=1 Tax=Winogradskyella eckloniae TaxID=1089306 RepID=UPI001566A7F3|nr:hypothetical protein [Winogradskyella eckloniae]NRD18446.1 hypothetical protein [Winogradskyella eckloniae]